MAPTLERYSLKRESGGMAKEANACTKEDLERMMLNLYKTVANPTDYQDAALLALLWYLLDRASDQLLLQKQHVSVYSRNISFLRFIRVKTAEGQGLTLFPDRNFVTCPLLVFAPALVTQ